MESIHDVKERKDGKIPTTTVTNELTRAVNSMLPSFQQGQGQAKQGGSDIWLIWDAGPASEANYTDNRYWLRRGYYSNPSTDVGTSAAVVKEIGVTSLSTSEKNGFWITATNIGEQMATATANTYSGSHLIPKGTPVRNIWLDNDSTAAAVHRWVFNIDPGDCVRVKVTSAASGGGKYNGRILTSSTTAVAATGDLAESDLGTVPSADNALVLNGAEVGKSTHDLTTGTPVAKVFPGYLLQQKSTGNVFVVVINGIDWENCT